MDLVQLRAELEIEPTMLVNPLAQSHRVVPGRNGHGKRVVGAGDQPLHLRLKVRTLVSSDAASKLSRP